MKRLEKKFGRRAIEERKKRVAAMQERDKKRAEGKEERRKSKAEEEREEREDEEDRFGVGESEFLRVVLRSVGGVS